MKPRSVQRILQKNEILTSHPWGSSMFFTEKRHRNRTKDTEQFKLCFLLVDFLFSRRTMGSRYHILFLCVLCLLGPLNPSFQLSNKLIFTKFIILWTVCNYTPNQSLKFFCPTIGNNNMADAQTWDVRAILAPLHNMASWNMDGNKLRCWKYTNIIKVNSLECKNNRMKAAWPFSLMAIINESLVLDIRHFYGNKQQIYPLILYFVSHKYKHEECCNILRLIDKCNKDRSCTSHNNNSIQFN
jgi:hypothetical protein